MGYGMVWFRYYSWIGGPGPELEWQNGSSDSLDKFEFDSNFRPSFFRLWAICHTIKGGVRRPALCRRLDHAIVCFEIFYPGRRAVHFPFLSSFAVMYTSSQHVPERNQDATIYVGNLTANVSEELLWELFLQSGPVVNVHIPKDKGTWFFCIWLSLSVWYTNWTLFSLFDFGFGQLQMYTRCRFDRWNRTNSPNTLVTFCLSMIFSASGVWVCWISHWRRCGICNQNYEHDQALWPASASEQKSHRGFQGKLCWEIS